MDTYAEYLLNQINHYRESMKEDPSNSYRFVIDELLQALTQYQNFKVKPFIS